MISQLINYRMRIKYIIPTKIHPNMINVGMYQHLCEEFQTRHNAEVVETSPDIVHIFGVWNHNYSHLSKNYRSIGIPVVFTSVDGMIRLKSHEGDPTKKLSTLLSLRKTAKSGTILHACGQMEKSAITGIAKSADVRIIPNSEFTAAIDTMAMADRFLDMYSSACTINDKKIREQISSAVEKTNTTDKCIVDICSRILYIKQRFIMQNIPQTFLDETASVMIESNYDENEMAQILANLRLTKFASSVMALLSSRANLTEGFMPIESTDGKSVRKMERVIIQ